jgi:hypothetical protein
MEKIKYIRGQKNKTKEIRKIFRDLGAINADRNNYDDLTKLYYLDYDTVNIISKNKSLGRLLIKHGEEIKLPKKKKKLPKTWEEWVELNPTIKEEFYIHTLSTVESHNHDKRCTFHYNNLSSKEDAEGLLTLIKLKRLRDCYNDGWQPDWGDETKLKFCISLNYNNITSHSTWCQQHFLAFRTLELRDEFLNNFEDLIAKAKMWL